MKWWVALALPAVAAIMPEQTTCAFSMEGQPASLYCPPGQVITSIDWAYFGAFETNSSCNQGLHPTKDCPTVVLAQAELLCMKRSTCDLSCDCNALRAPPCLCQLQLRTENLTSAIPAWPCNGVRKALGLVGTCSEPLAPAHVLRQLSGSPSSLMLEFMSSPVHGLDQLKPHFSWSAANPQSALRVNVSSPLGAPVWSSGKMFSFVPLLAVDVELPLRSDRMYQWTVELWSAADPPQWSISKPAHFSTGLLHQADWGKAEWINAGPCLEPAGWQKGAHWLPDGSCIGGLLRKDFVVAKVPSRVSIFVSGCHYYELFLDGVRVGEDAGITNSWTRFNLFRSYATMSLNPKLFMPGKHTLGIHVGQGFCGEPQAQENMTGTRAALLKVSLYDDSTGQELLFQSIQTDDTWQVGQSPLVWESAYYGEVYISNLEQPGWSTPGFTKQWPQAKIVYYDRRPIMSSQLQPPIVAAHIKKPISVNRVLDPDFTSKTGAASLASPARWTWDFGQEFSGHVKLFIPRGVPSGTNFTLRFGEVLAHPPLKVVVRGNEEPNVTMYDGSVYQGNLFWANQVDVFQSGSPNNPQVYEPRFTYHAFRYVELQVSPPLPPHLETNVSVESLLGINLRTAAREQSQLQITNSLLSKVAANSWWTEASGLIGIPHGAGARGERTGWTGDAAAASESEAFDFDSAAFFTQFLKQIAETSCKADGTIGNCVPNTDPRRDGLDAQVDPNTCSGLTADPTWSTVYVTIAHNVWKYYGATNVIKSHYNQLKQYMLTLEARKNATGLGQMFCTFGDWNPVVKTPCHITAALSYIHDVRRMVDLAEATGNSADAATWKHKSDELTAEFHSPCNLSNGKCVRANDIVYGGFWDGEKYSSGSQMSTSAALWLGGIPDGRRAALIDSLASELSVRGLTVGFVGVQYMFEALVKVNRADVAVECLLRTVFPGYGYEIYNVYEPATTLWESWTGDTMTQWLAESSRNHHYQTSINTFLRKYIIGLDMPHGFSAWAIVKARPEAFFLPTHLAAEIPSAQALIESHRGRVELSWCRFSDGIGMNATVPPTSMGELHVPMVGGAATTITLHSVIVWEDGAITAMANQTGIIHTWIEGNFVVFTTTHGQFHFVARADAAHKKVEHISEAIWV